jgi:hypothetical protein
VIYPGGVDRQPPRATSDEIDLYIRTYYSLLRSSGDVRVRAFEEAHLFSRSSLHLGAEAPEPDLAAFAYSAGRLPDCMPRVRRLVLGQSHHQFDHAGYAVDRWQVVRTRGRRRPLRWDGGETLAAFIASASDIDDLVPILTAYQIEWNKLRERLLTARISDVTDDEALAGALGAAAAVARLRGALGPRSNDILRDMIAHDCDLFVRLLDGSFREYQRSAQRWYQAIAPAVPTGRPVYFVSSNSHSLANLLGGYARNHRDEILAFLRARNVEDLAPRYDDAVARGDQLDRELGLPDRESRQHEMQIADLIGLQNPVRPATAIAGGQPAPGRQAADDDHAAWRHGIGAVERNREADMLAGRSLERARRGKNRRRKRDLSRGRCASFRGWRLLRPGHVDGAQPKCGEHQVWQQRRNDENCRQPSNPRGQGERRSGQWRLCGGLRLGARRDRRWPRRKALRDARRRHSFGVWRMASRASLDQLETLRRQWQRPFHGPGDVVAFCPVIAIGDNFRETRHAVRLGSSRPDLE